jgi:hypothetical protein
MSEESVVRIARVVNVSTEFVLGTTEIPDKKNYDISELGLSVQAAKNLWYRFGFEGDMEHPMNETAKHFHLSENMAKSTERSALDDNVRLELP